MGNIKDIEPWVIVIAAGVFVVMMLWVCVYIWVELKEIKRVQNLHNHEAAYWQERTKRLKGTD